MPPTHPRSSDPAPSVRTHPPYQILAALNATSPITTLLFDLAWKMAQRCLLLRCTRDPAASTRARFVEVRD